MNYVKDAGQTQETQYTVRYTIEGTLQNADTLIVKGSSWINESPALIAIGSEGIPVPADKYEGYKPDPENPTYPAAGTKVASGTVYTVNYVKDAGQTQETAYTVRHVVDGTERTEDTAVYISTAWINEEDPMIVIEEGSLEPKNYDGCTFTGMDSEVEEGESVASGTVITLTYQTVPVQNPTPENTDTEDAEGQTYQLQTRAAVLGVMEAPEVGVLGAAGAPETAVLGESKGPGTGDTAPILAWLILAAAAVTVIVAVGNRHRKNK